MEKHNPNASFEWLTKTLGVYFAGILSHGFILILKCFKSGYGFEIGWGYETFPSFAPENKYIHVTDTDKRGGEQMLDHMNLFDRHELLGPSTQVRSQS